MPIKAERAYREKNIEFRALQEEDDKYIVEGYATTFNDPYLLYNDGEIDIFEQVDARAFDNADMSDVIMQYDHNGKVFARVSNGTLVLSKDEHGLKVRADLSKSQGARELYEEIKAGLITRMSFAFTVEQDSYNKEKHLRSIEKIKKVYDVSAVSIPANPDTEINAESRSFCEGVIAEELTERLEREEAEKRRKANINKIKMLAEQ